MSHVPYTVYCVNWIGWIELDCIVLLRWGWQRVDSTTSAVLVVVANVPVPDAPILVVLVLLLRSGCTSDIVAVAVANLPGTDVRILVVQ